MYKMITIMYSKYTHDIEELVKLAKKHGFIVVLEKSRNGFRVIGPFGCTDDAREASVLITRYS